MERFPAKAFDEIGGVGRARKIFPGRICFKAAVFDEVCRLVRGIGGQQLVVFCKFLLGHNGGIFVAFHAVELGGHAAVGEICVGYIVAYLLPVAVEKTMFVKSVGGA